MAGNRREVSDLSLYDFFISSLKTLCTYVYDPSQNLYKMAVIHAIGVTEVVINTVTPYVIINQIVNKQMFDHKENNPMVSKQLTGLILVALTANLVLPRIRGLLVATVRRNAQREMSLDMVKRVYDGPLDEHIANPTGDLVATISKNYSETEKVMPISVELINLSLETLCKSVILYHCFGRVGLTPIGVYIPYFVIAFGGEVYGGLIKLSNQKIMTDTFDKLLESVNNYTSALQNDNTTYELTRLKNQVLKLEDSFGKVDKTEEVTALVVTMVNRLGFLASAASVYFNPPVTNFWTNGDAVIFAYYVLTSALKFETLPPKFNSLLTGIAGAFLVDKFFKTHPVLKDPDNPVEFNLKSAPAIEFKNVNFGYGNEKNLVDISFVVPAGSTVAIMGHTGCGKSTILKILQRLYDDYTGDVLVNGINIKNTKLSKYRRHIAVVSQNTDLIDDTLITNIKYSDFSATDETAIQAANYAKLSSLSDRFYQPVKKEGLNFSGGEKQRTLIARAFLKGCGYIFLGDEITSALDQKTSREILQLINALKKNVTKIIVTHDPNLIRQADLILCMKEGLIIQKGTFSELISAKQGEFYEMYATYCRALGMTDIENIETHLQQNSNSIESLEFARWANIRRNEHFFKPETVTVEDSNENSLLENAYDPLLKDGRKFK